MGLVLQNVKKSLAKRVVLIFFLGLERFHVCSRTQHTEVLPPSSTDML